MGKIKSLGIVLGTILFIIILSNIEEIWNPIVDKLETIGPFYLIIIFLLLLFLRSYIKFKNHITPRFVYEFKNEDEKINKEEIEIYRKIPLKKDIFRANTICKIYSLGDKDKDIIGAILLKWILEDEAEIVYLPDTYFKKHRIGINLKDELITSNESELEIFNIMKRASRNNILEAKELERWCKWHYGKLYKWLYNLTSRENSKLVDENLLKIGERNYLLRFYTVNKELRNEGLELAGLKKFLEEFTKIEEKQIIEVKLWREYLIYAQMFGIASDVAEQLKRFYPEILNVKGEKINIDYVLDDIDIINSLALIGTDSARVSRYDSAYVPLENNSSNSFGGSSSSGGRGSFGGGSGGGCR